MTMIAKGARCVTLINVFTVEPAKQHPLVELPIHISPDRKLAFEDAYRKAQAHLKSSLHCLGYELTRCVKEPQHYVLRIVWGAAEGHLQGFRTSVEFPKFFGLLRPFVADCQEMEHYEVTDVLWQR